jgi:hypothetical protein
MFFHLNDIIRIVGTFGLIRYNIRYFWRRYPAAVSTERQVAERCVMLKDKKGVSEKLLFSFLFPSTFPLYLTGALLLFPYIIYYLDSWHAGTSFCMVFCVPDG